MNISLILSQHGFSENIFYNQVGRLKGYTLRVLNFINESLQNERMAVTTAVISALAFSEIALKTSDYVINYLEESEWLYKLTQNDYTISNIKNAIYLGSYALIVTLLNLALYKSVSLNLSPVVYTHLNAITCVVCVMRNENFLRVWSDVAQNIREDIIDPLYARCFPEKEDASSGAGQGRGSPWQGVE